MVQDNTSLAAMAEALSRSTDYRVLRRVVPRTTFTPSVGEGTKTGILLDTETTGLDPRKDEVIELGMVDSTTCPTAASSASGTSSPRSMNHPSRSRLR